MLFYAMSRGLDKELAVKMIASGFIESVFKKTEKKEFIDSLNNLIENKMDYLKS
jgi:Fe-S cluster assembly scaffold protein SufB